MPERVFNPVGFAISDISRLLRRRYLDMSREAGLALNKSQSAVLIQLERRRGRPLNQTRLARLLEVEPMTLVPLLDHLEQAGLIERTADPADRRARLVALTPNAGPTLDRIHEIANRLFADAFEGLDDIRRQRLAEDLSLIRSNLLAALDETDVTDD